MVYRHKFHISSEKVSEFAAVTGDQNKLHFDDVYAKTFGFDGRLAHGFLVTSVFSKVFGTIFPGDGTIYLAQKLSFQAPVYVGSELEASFIVISKVGRKLTVRTCITNCETTELVVDGEAEVLISKEISLGQINE